MSDPTDPERALVRRLSAVRSWSLWSLPGPILAYVVLVELIAVIVTVIAAGDVVVRLSDLLLCAALLACTAALIEVRRGFAVPQPGNAVVKDMVSIWCLPIALLLPPVYGLLAYLPLVALTHWRVRTGVAYRRVFTAAAIMLALGAAGWVFHALVGYGHWPSGGGQLLPWTMAVLAAAVVRWVVNVVLVSVAIKATVPDVRWSNLIISPDSRGGDVVEVCLGTLSTVLVAVNPLLIVVTVPPVLMLQRAVQYAQLVAAVRRDAKTGLLNATAWDQEATDAMLRATREGQPLAVLLLDIDHFKRVNDSLGHLAGDRVLRAIADALLGQVRDGDLVGRFGGEEFAVLLPNTPMLEAERIAERLRHRVAQLVVPLDGSHGLTTEVSARVTVSIGVAALNGPPPGAAADLLATADRALYRAKGEGRNRVCVSPVGAG